MNLNYIFAWISMIGIVLLFSIYPLRKYLLLNKPKKDSLVIKTNIYLHKYHKSLGIVVLILSFIHCRLSSQKLGFNTGTFSFILMALLLYSYLARKMLKRKWLKIHRALSVILIVVLILHILFTRVI